MDWSRFDETHRRVSVVGYDFHQPALLSAGGRELRRDTDRYETTAELRREPDNPKDKYAIAVLVDDQRIGYVKAGTGRRLNKRLAALEDTGEDEDYPVLIRFKAPGKLQAHLQIPYSSKLLKGYKNTNRKRRR